MAQFLKCRTINQYIATIKGRSPGLGNSHVWKLISVVVYQLGCDTCRI